MHVIRDKKTSKILFIDHRRSTALRSGTEVYPHFDEKTMEVGWTEKPYIPAHFSIDKSGRVIEANIEERLKNGVLRLRPDQKVVKGMIVRKSVAELVQEKVLKIDELKEQAIEHYSTMAFQKRRELLPDYKLENAALGVYDERVTDDYKETVRAFRDEFYRIKTEIEKARSVEAIESVTARFPDKIISGKASEETRPATAKNAEPVKEQQVMTQKTAQKAQRKSVAKTRKKSVKTSTKRKTRE